jgi:hypothetical protein
MQQKRVESHNQIFSGDSCLAMQNEIDFLSNPIDNDVFAALIL